MNSAPANRISIESSLGEYTVHFGEFQKLKTDTSLFVYVIDDYFKGYPVFENLPVVWLTAVEENKSLTSVERIINELRALGVTKRHELVAIGGGIVQDVSTLASSLYMRGISWHYVPTTLLGMVDSCIGGKSSINTKTSKNLIGNIYPPTQVLIDHSFIPSLPIRDLASGLAEALKISYCGGDESFEKMLELLDQFQPSRAVEVVELSLSTKKWFIEIDEFDTSERLQLNFGHTFGHAIEAGTRFEIPHGLAVAVGMICASRWVRRMRIEASHVGALEAAARSLLKLGINDNSEINFDKSVFIDAFRSDKKHPPNKFRLVTPRHDCGVEIIEIPRTHSVETEILEIVEAVLGDFVK